MNIKRTFGLIAAAALMAGCASVQHSSVAQPIPGYVTLAPDGGTQLAQADGAQAWARDLQQAMDAAFSVRPGGGSAAVDEQVASSGLVTMAHHKTITTITDITDPEHPVEIRQFEGNLLGSCGVRNLMQLAIGGTGSSMGAASGAANTLGQRCAGVNEHSDQKVATGLTTATRILIGAGGPTACTASTGGTYGGQSGGLPFNCCTGNGTGCAISYLDQLLFSEGQPNGTMTNLTAIWADISSNLQPPNTWWLPVDSAPTPYWDGSNLMGIRLVATATNGIAEQAWCEYAVRAPSFNGLTPLVGAGPVSDSSGISSGWQINHALINPCITKPSGAIWQIEVRILLT